METRTLVDFDEPEIQKARVVRRSSFGESLRWTGAPSFAPDQIFASASHRAEESLDDEEALKWAALERLPTYDRIRTTILESMRGNRLYREEVDLRVYDESEAYLQKFIQNVFTVDNIEEGNQTFLNRLRSRMDKVGLELPSVEVRFEKLSIEGEAHIGGRALPTLVNNWINFFEAAAAFLRLPVTKKTKIPILRGVSGILKPARLTLLLGPPASGKTSLLLALAGRLGKGLKVSGEVTYNGHGMDEFIPQKTSAYVSQEDLHTAEMTVRETLEYSANSQGIGTRYDLLAELLKREKELGIHPEADIDFYMKATAMENVSSSLITAYIMKILSLDICADVLVGDAMIRGISGGQKKRLTTGELIVGPNKALFMDEISTGLDSSTTYQIVKCLRDICHSMDNTIIVSLLQPAPETFDLFDDIILLSEGQIVYQGPKDNVLEFFEHCGFKCPERKGIADFLQEVTSRKDQEQYWADQQRQYQFVPVAKFTEIFCSEYSEGLKLRKNLEKPFDKFKSHKAALANDPYSVTCTQLLKINFKKELLLFKRTSFVSIFRIIQLSFIAILTMFTFFRTEMSRETFADARLYAGALFFGILMVMFNGYAELSLTINRLPVFFKQRELLFLPAWAFAIPKAVINIPVSLYESLLWTVLTYYTIGFAPAASRFFKQFFLMFWVHSMSSSLFRTIAALCRSQVLSNTGGTIALFILFFAGGFLIPRERMKPWWIWAYWVSPNSYIQNGLFVNEFLAPQWANPFSQGGEPSGLVLLREYSMYVQAYWYWIAVGVSVGYTLLFNILTPIFFTYLNPIRGAQATVSEEELAEKHANLTGDLSEIERFTSLPRSSSASVNGIRHQDSLSAEKAKHDLVAPVAVELSHVVSVRDSLEYANGQRRGMILPFQPLALSFNNINYYVDMPSEMRQQGVTESRLQLLNGITGAFRPGVLTALVGVSGAGKTTLMDVLAGRKTGGYITGDIRIAGFPKKQETFARISGYCEQTDIHSPQLTVYESIYFSATLRLPNSVDKETKLQFVQEVMDLVELTALRDAMVGIPGVSGLSTEQRKRLTIAVELVANPSIIFMDEPTSGLDARAAAVVMRAVRNTVDTGRTVVCTIHQPSIDIFEAFDELLLMKRGGEVIFAGPLGRRSHRLVEYFEAIEGVQKIQEGYNPATWMLEVSSPAMEMKLGVNFSDVYRRSPLFQSTRELVEQLSKPDENAEDLYFPTTYSQNFFTQLATLFWKQRLTYWRIPAYNNVRYIYTTISSFLAGTMFWNIGSSRNTEAGLFGTLGGLYGTSLFQGATNSMTVQPVVATERTVFYRERAAGMYSSLPYALAQVLIELPYAFTQCILFSLITYSTMGLEWTPAKFFWYFFFNYFNLLTFTYYGMMSVSITPNQHIAAIVSTLFYCLFNLFAGFLVPRDEIPVWFRWYYWANPVTYLLYGVLTSQFGDVEESLESVDGLSTTVKGYMETVFKYDYDLLWLPALLTVILTMTFVVIFCFAIKKLNFQTR